MYRLYLYKNIYQILVSRKKISQFMFHSLLDKVTLFFIDLWPCEYSFLWTWHILWANSLLSCGCWNVRFKVISQTQRTFFSKLKKSQVNPKTEKKHLKWKIVQYSIFSHVTSLCHKLFPSYMQMKAITAYIIWIYNVPMWNVKPHCICASIQDSVF